MVMIFPMFVIMMMVVLKLFALVLVVQKAEIASAYASRKWMLEAHRNSKYFAWDSGLQTRISSRVKSFMGTSNFTGVTDTEVTFNRTQVWTQVSVEVYVKSPNLPLLCIYSKDDVCKAYDGPNVNGPCAIGYNYICGAEYAPGKKSFKGVIIRASKYVPVRDRPIAWSLPTV